MILLYYYIIIFLISYNIQEYDKIFLLNINNRPMGELGLAWGGGVGGGGGRGWGKLPTVRQSYLLSGKLPTVRHAPNSRIHASNRAIYMHPTAAYMHPKGIDMHPKVSTYFPPNNRVLCTQPSHRHAPKRHRCCTQK